MSAAASTRSWQPSRPADEHARQAEQHLVLRTRHGDHRLVASLVGGATIEGDEYVPASGAYILVAQPLLARRSADHRLGGGTTPRPDRPLHGEGGDAAVAGHRLARAALGRLLRASRGGRPHLAADRARHAGRGRADRRLPGGHPLARRSPARRQGRRHPARHALRRPAPARRRSRAASACSRGGRGSRIGPA